jgi:AcrR family transcriptional regulator
MRLFGEQGYAATTVAQIESAAGLKAGSGGLYRHFASKKELLDAGVREQVASQRQLVSFLSDPEGLGALPLRERLAAIAKAALVRLDQERDLNRIILRDLKGFPELSELVRTEEMNNIQAVLTGWLRVQIDPAPRGVDWDALAAALMGSVSHYWMLRDSMGTHPSGVDEERYLEALADLAAARLEV